jgi:hypothetical protein
MAAPNTKITAEDDDLLIAVERLDEVRDRDERRAQAPMVRVAIELVGTDLRATI